MTRDKIKEGDICTLDESVEYSYNPHKPYEVVVLWHGVNSQPLVTKLDAYKPFWTTYSQLIEVKRHIDLSIKALKQQTCGDAVSRQAVDDAIFDYTRSFDETAAIMEYINKLPSVQPETTTCEDAVSREAVLGLFAQNADATRPYSTVWEEVKALPSVNPQQKTGHWIEVAKYSDGKHKIECSKCGNHIFDRGHANSYNVRKKYKYCPSCGAKMVDKEVKE